MWPLVVEEKKDSEKPVDIGQTPEENAPQSIQEKSRIRRQPVRFALPGTPVARMMEVRPRQAQSRNKVICRRSTCALSPSSFDRRISSRLCSGFVNWGAIC